MFIKEEIITNTLKFIYETNIKPTDLCLVEESAATLWGAFHGSKYVNIYIAKEAYEYILTHPWLDGIKFNPILKGENKNTDGLISQGKYTILAHETFKDIKITEIEGIPVASLEYTIEGMTKKFKTFPYKEEYLKVLKEFEVGPIEIDFIKKVMGFDEYFRYSDDVNVYRNGVKRRKELLDLVENNQKLKQICKLLKNVCDKFN